MTTARWYVCDMDDGVLRVETTRTAAVRWWMGHQDAPRVVERHTYGPGYYSYIVGNGPDDGTDAAVVREDKLRAYGIDTPPANIAPRYPHADRPHDERG